MKFLLFVFCMLGAAVSGWWVTIHHPGTVSKIEHFINKGQLNTLELRFGATHIMEAHRRTLLKDSKHKFEQPTLQYYPYLLMEVKWSVSEHHTSEGVILWDLRDGEMVTDASNWEKTHGFGDCLKAKTTRNEFKIINILARRGGSVDRESMSKTLRVENEVLDALVDSCRKKQLIVQAGNRFRLHLNNPKFHVIPETKLDRKLVTQKVKKPFCFEEKFSKYEIVKLARAAFGDDFSIRKTTQVYLPVHTIKVKNPDGSVHTSHWNALNGRLLPPTQFIQ